MKQRKFEAARVTNTLQSWITNQLQSFDKEISQDLTTLKSRSRDASINSPYIRNYLKALSTKVVGEGWRVSWNKKNNITGKKDDLSNNQLKRSFDSWSKTCNIDGSNLTTTMKIIVQSVARDGAIFGVDFGPNQFKLQVIPCDYLAKLNAKTTPQGGYICNGVEYNSEGVVTHYWLLSGNPDDISKTHSTISATRIPTSNIIYVYDKERALQGLGIPWTSSVLEPLKHLELYTESELIQNRIASAKGILYKRKDDYIDPALDDDESNETELISEISAGLVECKVSRVHKNNLNEGCQWSLRNVFNTKFRSSIEQFL